jgi:hypothetical protein
MNTALMVADSGVDETSRSLLLTTTSRAMITPSCEPYQSTHTAMLFSFLYALIFLVGIFTNIIVICIFISKSGFRQNRNSFFIINLSIADIFVLVSCIPISITDLFSPNTFIYGLVYCKMYYFAEYCFTSVSSLTIIVIGVERYLSLVNPVTVIFDVFM